MNEKELRAFTDNAIRQIAIEVNKKGVKTSFFYSLRQELKLGLYHRTAEQRVIGYLQALRDFDKISNDEYESMKRLLSLKICKQCKKPLFPELDFCLNCEGVVVENPALKK